MLDKYNIFPIVFDLGYKIEGFSYFNEGVYYIIVNSRLTFQRQQEVFSHEIKHLEEREKYKVSLNNQYSQEEKEADEFAKEFCQAMRKVQNFF